MRIVRDPVCHMSNCRKKLGPATPRAFAGGVWWCADCLYEHEHGPAEKQKRRRLPKADEPLFP